MATQTKKRPDEVLESATAVIGNPEPVAQVAVNSAPVATPTVIMTELDAYLTERANAQPATLAEINARQIDVRENQQKRLNLPDFFIRYSYDHTNGKGQYIFRWLWKNKMAVDRAMNVVGWSLVNRRYFPDAPNHLFSANGGVEEGDAILAFMPAKKALAIRLAPAKKSKEIMETRTIEIKKDGTIPRNQDNPNFYVPRLDADREGEEGQSPAGTLQEGRDF